MGQNRVRRSEIQLRGQNPSWATSGRDTYGAMCANLSLYVETKLWRIISQSHIAGVRSNDLIFLRTLHYDCCFNTNTILVFVLDSTGFKCFFRVLLLQTCCLILDTECKFKMYVAHSVWVPLMWARSYWIRYFGVIFFDLKNGRGVLFAMQ